MILDKKALKKLNDELPYGSSVVIRDRVEQKTGYKFTRQYVLAVLDPDDPRKNSIIVEEAVEYRNELRAHNDDLNSRIFNS